MRLFFLLLLLVGLPGARPVAMAQPAPAPSVLDDAFVQAQAQRGLDLLYDMKFRRANVYFERIDQRYPNHPIGPFLKALNTWWKILVDVSDTSHDAAFYAAMEEVIARSDQMLARDAQNFDAMFFKGAALGFRGRLRSNRGDWFKSARDGLRAMDYVLGVARRDPGNHDYVFGKGIYDYYAAAIPDRYPYVKPVMVFFPDGDRARGIRALERTARHGRFIQTEAVYFLLQIYYLFENDYEKSVEYVTWLRERHPDNSFFHTFEGRVYARWGQWPRAEAVFTEVLARYKRRQTGYTAAMAEQSLYYLARGAMTFRRYAEALDHLGQLQALAARNTAHSYFEVVGRLRQGMAYDALGRRREAVAAYRAVLAMEDRGGAHERARRYLEHPFDG